MPVSLGVVLRPEPKILAGLLQRALGLPAEFLVGACGVGGQVEDVTGAAGRNFVGEVAADGLGEGADHLVDGATAAGTEVPGADTGVVGAEVVKGLEVAVGQVENVDVVADGGAVVGLVVYFILALALFLAGVEKERGLPSPKTSSFSRLPVAT